MTGIKALFRRRAKSDTGERKTTLADVRDFLRRINKKKALLFASGFVVVAGVIVLTVLLSARVDKTAAIGTVLENGVFRIGLRGDVAGMSYYDEETGEYSGLEVDVAQEIAARLLSGEEGVPVELVRVNTKSAVSMLSDGDIDIAFGCFVAESAQKGVNYTQPYYTDALVFLKSHVTEGVPVVGVVRNTYAQIGNKLENYFKDQGVTAELRVFGAYQDAIASYTSGRINSFCAGSVMLDNYAPDYERVENAILPHGYCAMVDSDRVELYRVINSIIIEMERDATLAEMCAGWGLPQH